MSELTEPADGGEIGGDAAVSPGFSVELEVYSGPFDALLSMIANRRLELTEVAFLDVASVLVEAKSAALLPHDQADGERDEQSLEALRERDLLFARLLQYRAFKQTAGDFRARLAANAGRFPHPAYVDERGARRRRSCATGCRRCRPAVR